MSMSITSRLATFAFALFIFLTLACASPIPSSESETVPSLETLEKRTTHWGQATFFYPGLGACGDTDDSNDLILAISSDIYGSGGNCNQWIKITNTDNGKVAYGKTRDECPGCGTYSLDLSPAVFKELGSLDKGVLPIKWNFQAKGWAP